jgi:L-lactate dehydrogenase complex protein LldG
MRDDRAQVLAQVKQSLKSALLPSARATIPPRSLESAPGRAMMVENFCRELELVGGKTYRAETSTRAIEIVVGLLRASGGNEILAWDDAELPSNGLGDALRAAGFARLDPFLPAEPEPRRARLAELERASVGITGALAGLADTGSLALLSAPARARLASLLPPIHIALLSTASLYPTMASFFAAHPNVARESSNLVFVTGPSRTADIELTLTRGVHGPREVHVVLIP